jgi:tRNA dimethylallyltransferase
MNKLLVILGPTASGKTSLAVKLARLFNGEIISADSRQVYKGMDIGTGKDLAEYGKGKNKIPYHLIDVVKPMTEFNAGKFKRSAERAIDDIISRNKLPILAGGTGLYISSIVDNYQFPKGKPDKLVRKKVATMTLKRKLNLLKKLDLATYKKIDKINDRRVDRALEVCLQGQKFSSSAKKPAKYNILQLGLKFPKNVLDKRIDQRVDERLDEGMIAEVKRLHKNGTTWRRLENFGLEYRHVAQYLQKKLDKDEMTHLLKIAIHQFAKRQMTWFKRDSRINWVKNFTEAKKLTNKFLKSS